VSASRIQANTYFKFPLGWDLSDGILGCWKDEQKITIILSVDCAFIILTFFPAYILIVSVDIISVY